MRRSKRRSPLAVVALCCIGCWVAQPPTIGWAADGDDVVEHGLFADWLTFGDVRLRGDAESRGPAEDLSRGRVSVRAGLAWLAGDAFELGAAVRVAAGTDDVSLGADNEERDGVRLDQAYLRWFPSDGMSLTVGKAPNELWLTPMVWDDDFRPIGIAFGALRDLRLFDSFRLVGALYRGDHRFDDESTIGAAQAVWSIREGAARNAEIALAYLRFGDLEQLAATGLRRGNRTLAGRFVSDFELIDFQVAGRIPLGAGSFEARLNRVHNLGAKDEDDGTRVSLVWVDRPLETRQEAGVVAQRVQADAVVAAFNSDDWWFHTAARGVGAWFAYRPGPVWTFRVAGFSERLDGRDARFERLLLDIELHW